MLKKENKLLILFICLLLLVGCKKTNEMKKDYESFNKDGYVTVELSEDNPFVKSSDEDIDKLIEEKATFVVFYGNKEDNYTRGIISLVSDKSLFYGIKTVYYVEKNSDIPQLVGYIDGLLSGKTNCISGYQTDELMEITEEMKSESETKITDVIKPISEKLSSCDIDVGC